MEIGIQVYCVARFHPSAQVPCSSDIALFLAPEVMGLRVTTWVRVGVNQAWTVR